MQELILYPTETVYGLGVNALDHDACRALFALKKRPNEKAVSWLVRDIHDMEQYAVMGDIERKIVKAFLPGPLTLVLPVRHTIIEKYQLPIKTVAFRISSDPIAQRIISEYMKEHNAPLTCTSANISAEKTQATVPAILKQFGTASNKITKIYDDGPRQGTPSTVISVVEGMVGCIRDGAIPFQEILKVIS